LILRAFKPEDFDAFAAIMADGEWTKFVGGPLDRDRAWRVFAIEIGHWHLKGYGMFALEEKATGTFIGMVGHWDPEGWPEPEIAYTLAQSTTGKGYATEAVQKMIDHTYETLQWPTVVSYIDDANEASQKVAARVGAIAEDLIELKGHPTRVHRHPNPNK
jgi:RimJ/RimL family protein N-acetyltransferase